MDAHPKLSFDNLENAFGHKSNFEVEQAYWLFKVIGNPALVKMGSSVTELALKYHLPIKGMVKATIFKQFCGGENIEECANTIQKLGNNGVGSILDYSVEGKEEENEFDHACDEIVATVKRAKSDKNIPFSVFKVTGLARFDLLEKVSKNATLSPDEEDEYTRVMERVDKICKEGFDLDVCVFIDAEETWIQPAIDALATQIMHKYNAKKAIIYNTIQLYRHDRLGYLKVAHAEAITGNYFLGLKLVRGAYMEKERARALELNYPSPIQATKEDSDRDYDLALEYCCKNIDRISICAGTHNEKSSLYLSQLMQQYNISHNDTRIYFSQLLGMSDHISFNLARAGYNIAKYVPYGPIGAVLPYLTRRAQENSSMSGQMGRELSLLVAEKKRRKGK
jgi:proline dehydrogenase